jgi:hypothetical protein
MYHFRKISIRAVAAVATLALVAPAVMASMASAASLSAVTVRFDRMKISTPTTGTICAKPASTATEASVKVTYPTGYTLGVASVFTVDTTNTAWPTGAVAWPSVTTASNVTGQVVTFPSGDLTVGTLYCFNWNNSSAVTVTGSASTANSGAVETDTSAPAVIDTASYTTNSIANDQIVVTATVPQAFSFALSSNTDNIGIITSGTVASSPTPVTVTINTNAAGGYNVWAKDVNTGLFSAAASNTIASTTPGTNSTLVGTANGYNTGVTQTGGSTVTAPFVGGVAQGGGLNTTLQTIAGATAPATSHVLTLTNHVAVAGSNKAATDYTDTITVVGAATF